jgi:hypothetical protein
MTGYLLPLLAVVLLCAFWALFQQWLSQADPDAKQRSLKCGGCGRRGECDAEERRRVSGAGPES